MSEHRPPVLTETLAEGLRACLAMVAVVLLARLHGGAFDQTPPAGVVLFVSSIMWAAAAGATYLSRPTGGSIIGLWKNCVAPALITLIVGGTGSVSLLLAEMATIGLGTLAVGYIALWAQTVALRSAKERPNLEPTTAALPVAPLTPALSPTVESLPKSESIVGERGQNLEPVRGMDIESRSRLGGSLALSECLDRIDQAIRWLIDLQNRDGGFPTFCRGWGTLPFDRSSPDITAHCLRAILAWLQPPKPEDDPDLEWDWHLNDLQRQALDSLHKAERFLWKVQRPDGDWLPLWFGNQHVPNDENPVYGTSRVLRAFTDQWTTEDFWSIPAQRGVDWLYSVQNPDGGWGGDSGAPSTVEETALALDALLDAPLLFTPSPSPGGGGEPEEPTLIPQPSNLNDSLARGVEWLIQRVEDGSWTTPSPIGFYFAKLWYYEALYPAVWIVAALRKAVHVSQLHTAFDPGFVTLVNRAGLRR